MKAVTISDKRAAAKKLEYRLALQSGTRAEQGRAAYKVEKDRFTREGRGGGSAQAAGNGRLRLRELRGVGKVWG